MVRSIILIAFLTILNSAQARDVLFEGYYKVMAADKHIGFSISRYEFDPQQKKFYSTQFIKISSAGTDIIESLSAVSLADERMTPVSYKYTALVDKESKTIDAKFSRSTKAAECAPLKINKKNPDCIKMTGTLKEGRKKPVHIKTPVEHNVFLSTFLSYRMLRSSQGIQTKNVYDYNAIAEEDGIVVAGKAAIVKEEKFKGFSALRVENTFKRTLFINHMNDKGEALSMVVKDARISSELVAKASEAVGTIGLPESSVKNIFGNIPTGDKNVVAQYFKNPDSAPKGGKQQGFPAGEGVQIKNQKPPKKEGS